ncbi:hypothetical protein DQ237_08470 [Blastococcus sp. TF02-8]|uniref:putative bifunctional diguanylate cyclase/phosphodiesterase n=1 Tax=Blastococcus sp. TF02-8 TaxID=2250574 RepID=UPI000DE9EAF5|nr:bifunctional diguanylate cyclase/phosphodiesterase [Blastococcus sp. TF02-8]RBY96639.1 hypothetical protein DQ237_08470 [Blastococcus sp. TF02-8]
MTPRQLSFAPAAVLLGALGGITVGVRLIGGTPAVPSTALLMALSAVVATVAVLRRARRLDPASQRSWRFLAVAGALLGVGELLAGLDDRGLAANGWPHLPQGLAVPAVIACIVYLLPPRAGRRVGVRDLLDGAVVLLAVSLVGALVLSDAAARTTGIAGAMLTIGYPSVVAVLCGIALMGVSRVAAERRRSAVALLVSMVALAVVALAGATARLLGSTTSDVLTDIAWSVMLLAAVRAVSIDGGQRPAADEASEPGQTLFGVVVSHATAYGVFGITLGLVGAGHDFTFAEQILTGLLLAVTSVRSLFWATDGARVSRRLLQTEAYFRALAASAEDVTVVLDDEGCVRWVSGATLTQLGRTEADLTGRPLADLVVAADRAVLARVVSDVAVSASLPPTVRLATAAGDLRDIELSGVARAGVPGTALREGLVLHLRDVTARRSSQRELERMAYTDFLTGLPNRARFVAELDAAHARAAAGEPFGVLLVDLDGFKAVNDVAGHDAGDRLLCLVADQLRQGAREQDLVARLGGDEFALLVPGDLDEATALAERLVVSLDRTFRAPGPGEDAAGLSFAVSGSIGVAPLDPAEPTTAAVRQADLALRAAKSAGKRCVRSSGEALDDALVRRSRLARDLPGALETGQLRVLYQPVVGLEDRRVLGLEALVRWEHPLLGTVGPDDFIPLAEEDGLIVPLERWVLETAAADAARLLAEGWDLMTSVNVSMRHLQAGCLAPDVARALAGAGLPAGKLILELTESVMLDQQDGLESDLATLRGMGVVLALDDFGRGYSSLAYLARLPVQILKMDREFIADIDTDPRGRALVASIVELGQTLGMDVLAEGVETDGQLAELRAMDCRFLQGYLFARPMPLAELRVLLSGFDPGVLDGRPTDLDPGVHLVGQGG